MPGLKEFPSYIICPDYSCSLTAALIALTASLFTVNSRIWHLTVCVCMNVTMSEIVSTYFPFFFRVVHLCVHALVSKCRHRNACQECSLKLNADCRCTTATQFTTSCQEIKGANTCSSTSLTASRP